MFLFCFPLFAEKKVNAKRNSDMLRKPPPPISLGKLACIRINEKTFSHVIAVHACIKTRGPSLWCLLVEPDHGKTGYLIAGLITSNPLEGDD